MAKRIFLDVRKFQLSTRLNGEFDWTKVNAKYGKCRLRSETGARGAEGATKDVREISLAFYLKTITT